MSTFVNSTLPADKRDEFDEYMKEHDKAMLGLRVADPRTHPAHAAMFAGHFSAFELAVDEGGATEVFEGKNLYMNSLDELNDCYQVYIHTQNTHLRTDSLNGMIKFRVNHPQFSGIVLAMIANDMVTFSEKIGEMGYSPQIAHDFVYTVALSMRSNTWLILTLNTITDEWKDMLDILVYAHRTDLIEMMKNRYPKSFKTDSSVEKWISHYKPHMMKILVKYGFDFDNIKDKSKIPTIPAKESAWDTRSKTGLCKSVAESRNWRARDSRVGPISPLGKCVVSRQ